MAEPTAPPSTLPHPHPHPVLPRRTRRTRFVCISDTHNRIVPLPRGDVLVHCGDLTNHGSARELRRQIRWLEGSDFECKIVVARSHDLTLDRGFYEQYGAYYQHQDNPQDPAECRALLLTQPSSSLTYLEHESRTISLTSPTGPRTTFTVFGSPWSPRDSDNGPGDGSSSSRGRAFQYTRDSREAESLWSRIPLDTDILITHGPARTHIDEESPGRRRPGGCETLRRTLWRVRPRLALCGGVHGARGAERVRWDLGSRHVRYREDLWAAYAWADPDPETETGSGRGKTGRRVGGESLSLVDLTRRGGFPLDNDGSCCSSSTSGLSSSSSSHPRLPRRLGSREGGGPGDDDDGGSKHPDNDADPGIGTRGLGGTPGSAWSDREALDGRRGRRETCFVNCAVVRDRFPRAWGLPGSLNKPVVVDLDLPVWDVEEGV
ncbi:Metallo-dependent phosphatase-like protein [Xylariomycetidae sp. FL2044]|nr:Metallo-dependent phosphatase-like protein [Xylariomycetidae sp. FL2044]